MSNDDNDNNKNNNNPLFQNPYATLNITQNASKEEIQKSYKLLSRSFHPDKQPVQNRDQAQQYFIQLKSAYDILMDPVHKFAYDQYGQDGVMFLKRHTRLYKQIESLLSQQQEGDNNDASLDNNTDVSASVIAAEQKAKDLFNEAMQHYNFQMTAMKQNKPMLSGSIKVNCNTTHSHLLQEGVEPLSLDVDETRIAFSMAQPPNKSSSGSKLGLTCGASSSLKSKTGEGSTDAQITLDYEPAQGTEISANISTGLIVSTESLRGGSDGGMGGKRRKQQGLKPNFTISSSRVMSNNTYVHASLAAPLKSIICFGNKTKEGEGDDGKNKKNDNWLASFTSQRSLFEDKIRCTWIAGVSIPDTRLRYGMISIATSNKEEEEEDDDDEHDDRGQTKQKNKSWSKPAKHTLKLNLGMSHTPVQISTVKEITENQTGAIECGYGPMGMDFKILSTRLISKFCKLSLGVRHISSTGLSTLFKLERGGLNFTVPVLVSTSVSREYTLKSIYVTIFMGLINTLLGESLEGNDLSDGSSSDSSSATSSSNLFQNNNDITPKGKKSSREDILLEREKKKRDRAQQIQLMTTSANAKMIREEAKEDGLVILMAKYEVTGGDSIDVTIALQFWVMNSSLHLPSMNKSNMLGFYDVRPETPVRLEGGVLNSWQRTIQGYLKHIIGGTGGNRKLSQMEAQNKKQKEHQQQKSTIPTLTVRYRHKGSVYEITVLDDEELSIPCSSAMMLGGSYVI